MVARVTITYTNIAITEFEDILNRLRRDPTDIEEIDELKSFMITAPNLVKGLELQLENGLTYFNILESVNYKLSPQDFELRWQLFGWPKRINDTLEQLEQTLVGKTNDFLEQMRDEQVSDLYSKVDVGCKT